jgi:hypothetical protein
MDNIKHIDQVLKILSKSLDRKYPYFGKIHLDTISEDSGVIFIKIDVDYNEFLEYNNLHLRPGIEQLLQEFPDPNPNEYVGKQYGFLHIVIEANEEIDEKFGWRFNVEVCSYLDEMLVMLPESIVPRYVYVGTFSNVEYPATFSITKYNLTFDPDRYLKYINK